LTPEHFYHLQAETSLHFLPEEKRTDKTCCGFVFRFVRLHRWAEPDTRTDCAGVGRASSGGPTGWPELYWGRSLHRTKGELH